VTDAPFQYPDMNMGKRYAEFMENLPIAVYRTTIEGKVIFCNKLFMKMFGFSSKNEMINYPVIKLYKNKKDRGLLIKALIENHTVMDMPFRLVKKDGTPISVLVTAKTVFDSDGNVVFLDGSVKEISAKDRNKSEMDKLEGVIEMAGGASHRLNQPLMILTNVINELLEETAGDDKKLEKMKEMHRQIMKINDITKKIGRINRYKPMDYVAGLKIVDIDNSSQGERVTK